MAAPRLVTETDRANAALQLIGEPPISSLDDNGRRAARECKRAFGKIRDGLLKRAPWNFATASTVPPSIGASPDGVFLYRYAMPEDCVAVRLIQNLEDNDWQIAAATLSGDPRVMVDTSVVAPRIVYTKRMDNPAQWDELFSDVFDLMLAGAINPAVGRDKGLTESLRSEAEARLLTAKQNDSREKSSRYVTRATSWVRSRYGYRRPL